MCFQSLILDMAGNVGTQSLAVTIRVLMDENLTAGEKVGLVFKEMKVGFFNGLFLGIMAFIFIGLYIWLLKGNPVVHAFVDFWLRRIFIDGGNGDFQFSGNFDSDVFP